MLDTVAGATLPLPQDLSDPAVRQRIIRQFAPQLLLHPFERALPMDPAAVFAASKVQRAANAATAEGESDLDKLDMECLREDRSPNWDPSNPKLSERLRRSLIQRETSAEKTEVPERIAVENNSQQSDELKAETLENDPIIPDAESKPQTKDETETTESKSKMFVPRASENILRTPLTAQMSVHNDEFIRINYWFFYPWNGFQMFMLSGTMNSTYKYFFEIPPLAYHEGDWEHVTVVLDRAASKIEWIGATAHGEQELVPHVVDSQNEDPVKMTQNERHLPIYVALNSHASYLSNDNAIKGDRVARRAIHVLSPWVHWTWRFYTRLDVIDCLSLPNFEKEMWLVPHSLEERSSPLDYIKWNTWEADTIHDLSDPNSLPDWARYTGGWGLPFPEEMHQNLASSIEVPHHLPGKKRLGWILRQAAKRNKIDVHYAHFNPPGPAKQRWHSEADLLKLTQLKIQKESSCSPKGSPSSVTSAVDPAGKEDDFDVSILSKQQQPS